MNIEVKEKESIRKSSEAAKVFRSLLSAANEVDREKEHFWVLGLDQKNRIKYIELVSLGTLNSTLVHPREVFRMAIMKAVASLIVGHNHPSGDPLPSTDDIATSKKLKESGSILGISVMDHIIVTQDGSFLSLQDKGYM